MNVSERRAEGPRDDLGGGKALRRPPKMVRNRRGARVRINRRDHYLGKWGSPEIEARYAELIA